MEERDITIGKDGARRLDGACRVSIRDGLRASIVIGPEAQGRIWLSIGKGCSVDMLAMRDRQGSIEIETDIGEGSCLRSAGLWLASSDARIVNRLSGYGATAQDIHLFIGRKGDRIKLDSRLIHQGRETKGDILVKGIVKEGSRADLDGMIRIEPDGSGAGSLLSEHVLLLDGDSHASARPRLEIANDDVQSSHSASVAPIDQEKIFYLMSRGLLAKEAESLIVQGFLSSAIDQVSDEGMRKELFAKALSAL